MKKSTLISAIFMSLFLTTLPISSKAVDIAFCFIPGSYGNQQVISGCRGTSPSTFCADNGFIVGSVDFNQLFCIDRNCVVADETQCRACSQGFYIKQGRCYTCPSGASCDGYTIQCADGYFHDGSKCQRCDSSCKTCSGTKNTQCTSCYAGYSNVDGECIADISEPTKTNTVNSCPSRMTLSSDGCCCINK